VTQGRTHVIYDSFSSFYSALNSYSYLWRQCTRRASEDNLKQRAMSQPTITDRHPSKASITYQKHLLSQSLYPLLTVPLARVANANPGLRLQHLACVRTPRHMAIPHSQTSRKHISPQNQRLMSVVAVPVEAPGARCLCACACGCACSDVHVSVGIK
jgi:hypothetical protein